MSIRLKCFRPSAAVFGAVALAALGAGPARAQSVTKECAAKYQADKAADKLNGRTYLQYYSECSAEIRKQKDATPGATEAPATPAATAPEPAPAPPPAAAAPAAEPPVAQAPAKPEAPAKPAETAKPAKPAKPEAASPAATGPAIYPTAVNPAYAKEKPGKAREKTCLDQYNANKPTGGNGGLKWIQKGGGYYSECNKRLKG